MSLLDTFAILFETDAGEAADDVDRLGDALDDTGGAGQEAARGVDAANQAAADSTQTMGGLVKGLAGVVAGYLSWQAISAAVFSQAIQTDEVGKFADTMGLAIGEVDAWGEAVVRNGGSVDAFRGSVESMNDALTDMALTGGGPAVEVLGRLGIQALDSSGKIRKSTDVMLEMADAFQGLSEVESAGLAKRLGLDQGTILMLQQGRVAVEQMVEQQRQLGGRTQEGYEAAAVFNDTLADTQRMFVGVADGANQRILPVLTSFLKGLQTVIAWAQEHQDVVVGFFGAVAAIITAVYLPAMTAAAVATLTAAAPFILIGAVIAAVGAAFALLYEDVKAYIGGQESFVGNLAKKYEWFGKLLDGVIAGAKWVWQEFTDFVGGMAENAMGALDFLGAAFEFIFGKMGGDMETFNDVADVVVDAIIAAFRMMADIIGGILDFIVSPIETAIAGIEKLKGLAADLDIGGMASGAVDAAGDAIGGALSSVGDKVGSWFSDADDEEEQMLQRLERQSAVALQMSNAANTNPVVTSPGAVSTMNNRNVNQQFTFQNTINANGLDRDQASSLVNERLVDQVRSAKGTMDDGVAY